MNKLLDELVRNSYLNQSFTNEPKVLPRYISNLAPPIISVLIQALESLITLAEQAKDEVEADSEYEMVRTRKSNKSLQSNMSDATEDRTVRSRHSMEPSGMNSGDDFEDSGKGKTLQIIGGTSGGPSVKGL